MEGAASVIAVVSLALQSTQTINNIVSGFRNASPTIEQMTINLQDLSEVLKQINSYAHLLDDATELPKLVGRCADFLKTMEKKLGKLSSPTGDKAKNFWKNVKFTLQQSDLDRMAALLQHHIAVLSLQMNLVGGKVSVSNTTRLERVRELANRQITLATTNSETLRKTNAGVNTVQEDVHNIRTTSQAIGQSTYQAMEQVGDKLRDLTGMSTEQSSTLNAILELLKQQIPVNTRNDDAGTSLPAVVTHDLTEAKEERNEASNDDDLHAALDRLCQFAKEKERTVFSAEAESIILDIAELLSFLLEADEGVKNVQSRKKIRGGSNGFANKEDRDLQYRKEVKNIKNLIDASHCVAINGKVPRPLTSLAATSQVIKTFHRRYTRKGTFIFRTRRRIHDVAATPHDYGDDFENHELGTMDASITFVPKTPQSSHIAVCFQQRMLFSGSFLKKPILSVSALLPDDSEVFLLIQRGDLNSLVKKLSLREASLTARDSKGRSLLNHAIYSAAPDICKFLIDEGADVDFIESHPFMSDDDLANSLNIYSHNVIGVSDYDDDSHHLELTNQCRRLLLEAGADPTVDPNGDYRGSFLNRMLDTGTTESLRILLNYGREFINADDAIAPDKLLFKLLDRNNWTFESVSLLLRMQETSSVKVQSLEGCLIQALRGSCLENRKGVENALILLMETGASIYGEGHCEFTLTKYLRPVEQRGPRCGSSIRFPRRMTEINKRLTSKDLWASALNACGYDADKVISSMLSTDWPIRTHDRIVGYEARWASALNACGHDADKVISSMLSIDRPIRTHDRIVGYGARGPSLYVSDYSITEILSSTPRFQHDSKYSRKIIIYHDKVRGLDAPHR